MFSGVLLTWNLANFPRQKEVPLALFLHSISVWLKMKSNCFLIWFWFWFCPHKSAGVRRVSEACLNKQKHQTPRVETTNGCAVEGRGHIPEELQTSQKKKSIWKNQIIRISWQKRFVQKIHSLNCSVFGRSPDCVVYALWLIRYTPPPLSWWVLNSCHLVSGV